MTALVFLVGCPASTTPPGDSTPVVTDTRPTDDTGLPAITSSTADSGTTSSKTDDWYELLDCPPVPSPPPRPAEGSVTVHAEHSYDAVAVVLNDADGSFVEVHRLTEGNRIFREQTILLEDVAAGSSVSLVARDDSNREQIDTVLGVQPGDELWLGFSATAAASSVYDGELTLRLTTPGRPASVHVRSPCVSGLMAAPGTTKHWLSDSCFLPDGDLIVAGYTKRHRG